MFLSHVKCTLRHLHLWEVVKRGSVVVRTSMGEILGANQWMELEMLCTP